MGSDSSFDFDLDPDFDLEWNLWSSSRSKSPSGSGLQIGSRCKDSPRQWRNNHSPGHCPGNSRSHRVTDPRRGPTIPGPIHLASLHDHGLCNPYRGWGYRGFREPRTTSGATIVTSLPGRIRPAVECLKTRWLLIRSAATSCCAWPYAGGKFSRPKITRS
jgi:hypothetical protein